MVLPFPEDLVLTPISRWPTTLRPESLRAVLETPLGATAEEPLAQSSTAAPAMSIVVVTLNGLIFSRLCLESLLAQDRAGDYEVIVVDNGSTDGTTEYLRQLARSDGRVRLTCNKRNLGFAAASNRGVAVARGHILVLLNNDTIVSAGWRERILKHLACSDVGLLGVVTNRAGNEAEIEVPYRTYGELLQFAPDRMQAHAGELFDIRTVTMFCAALRREVWNAIGPLDERFEVGLFEDADYAMRVRAAGYRVVCAEDIFVHHFGQATIGTLGPTGKYGDIYHANRTRWESKWGRAWTPHERREKTGYREFVERVRIRVDQSVPPNATIAVISKGDVELLKLGNRRAWHFPQDEEGTYAGFYPRDSDACIAELERLRSRGAQFLVIPASARWWLTYYTHFAEHLQTRYRACLDDHSPATIVPLSLEPSPGSEQRSLVQTG